MYHDWERQSPADLPGLHTSSLTGAIERQLEHLILTVKIRPGGRLNENQFSTRFGTSRGPRREAMRNLHAKGIVDIIRNRGVFVRAILLKEALEIYDVRAAIFGLAGRLLVDRLTDSMLAVMHDYLARMDAIAAAQNFEEYYPVNLAFHDFLVTATENATLIAEYRSFVNKLHLFRARGLVQPGGLSVSNQGHREMVTALAAGDRERAQEAFFRHVERSKLRVIAALQSVPN